MALPSSRLHPNRPLDYETTQASVGPAVKEEPPGPNADDMGNGGAGAAGVELPHVSSRQDIMKDLEEEEADAVELLEALASPVRHGGASTPKYVSSMENSLSPLQTSPQFLTGNLSSFHLRYDSNEQPWKKPHA